MKKKDKVVSFQMTYQAMKELIIAFSQFFDAKKSDIQEQLYYDFSQGIFNVCLADQKKIFLNSKKSLIFFIFDQLGPSKPSIESI